MNVTALTHQTELLSPVSLRYLLYTPANYEQNAATNYPLILFLHGSGERGDDLNLVRRYGLTKKLDSQPDFPFIVVAPQCPGDSIWVFQLDALNALLDYVLDAYHVDRRRVYLTGMSMGGTGAWFLAQRYPQRFAAIAPVCGRNTGTAILATIRRTPIWVFHGAKDPIISIDESERMVTALRQIDADVRFTIYPEADHDSWTQAYNEAELYDWFLRHQLT